MAYPQHPWNLQKSKRGETDGHTQGYKNPPVPRLLVDQSQVPPSLSPAYPNSGENVPRPWLASEFGKIRAGTKTGFQLCRLPVRSQVRSGPTHTGPVAEPFLAFGGLVCADRISNCPLDRVLTYKKFYLLIKFAFLF